MGMREEPAYQQIEGKCRECGETFTYHNSVKKHPTTEICPNCAQVEKVPA